MPATLTIRDEILARIEDAAPVELCHSTESRVRVMIGIVAFVTGLIAGCLLAV